MRSSLMKPLRLLVLAIALVSVRDASAQDLDGAGNFLQNLADQALAVLARQDISDEQAVEEAQRLLRTGFDLQTIGRFVLGRYWNMATDDQRREYMALFERMVLTTYTSRFNEYEGSTFDVGEARAINERDMVIASVLNRPGAPPLNISWRVRQRPDGFQIIDVSVEGVSMAVTQRNDFASVIQRNGGRFEALLQRLRQMVG